MKLAIAKRSLVVLIGPSGAGKSTFAAKHFRPTEVVSSDGCRALVSDRENNMAATAAAFRVLHAIAAERLRAGRLTVIDATSVQPESRQPLVELARRHAAHPIAIVFDLPEGLYLERNRNRAGRSLPEAVIQRQLADMRRSLHGLKDEGFVITYVLDSPEAIDSAVLTRRRVIVEDKADLIGRSRPRA